VGSESSGNNGGSVTIKQIQARRARLEKKLQALRESRKALEAELVALQHTCPHKNTETHSDGGGYKGSDWSTTYRTCADCGLEEAI
jgi:hypothetical protein